MQMMGIEDVRETLWRVQQIEAGALEKLNER